MMTSSSHACIQPATIDYLYFLSSNIPHQLSALGLQHWPVPLPEILHGHLPHFLQVFIQMIGLPWKLYLKLHSARYSLDVQWVRTHRFHCWGLGSITGWGIKIPQTVWPNIYIHTYISEPHCFLPYAPSYPWHLPCTTYSLFVFYQSLNLSTSNIS